MKWHGDGAGARDRLGCNGGRVSQTEEGKERGGGGVQPETDGCRQGIEARGGMLSKHGSCGEVCVLRTRNHSQGAAARAHAGRGGPCCPRQARHVTAGRHPPTTCPIHSSAASAVGQSGQGFSRSHRGTSRPCLTRICGMRTRSAWTGGAARVEDVCVCVCGGRGGTSRSALRVAVFSASCRRASSDCVCACASA